MDGSHRTVLYLGTLFAVLFLASILSLPQSYTNSSITMAANAMIAILVALGSLTYYLYRLALPKPLPGIPYNKASANRLSGDLPGLLVHYKQTKEIASFSFAQCRALGSPIVQLFLRPFSPPVVFLDDPRESEDVLLRRTPREFDRAPSTTAFFAPLVPEATMVMRSADPRFRPQRRLWQDTMAPAFLRRAVAPAVNRCADRLVRLWARKGALAQGRPFEALEDLKLAAFDAIWVAMLGQELSGVEDEMAALAEGGGAVAVVEEEEEDEGKGKRGGGHVRFRQAERSVMYRAIEYVNGTIEKIMRNPFPARYHWWLRQKRQYKYYTAFKDSEIDRLVANARLRFEKLASEGDIVVEEDGDTCAMDLVLRREAIAFAKTGQRSSASSVAAMRDELAMLLVAGHETTAITLGWGLKTLADNQEQQTKLRQVLQQSFPSLPKGSTPSVSDILSTAVPYLDGALEEILRFANTVPLLPRSATVDTTILGYHIPKGTQIMCNAQFMEEPLDVPEDARSASSREARERRGRGGYATEELAKFMPERWIKKNAEGGEEFDPAALTRLQFSVGPRGCFGRKLAMQQLKVFLFLLVWNFEFLPVPDALNSRHGIQKILRPPQQCFVRLRTVEA